MRIDLHIFIFSYSYLHIHIFIQSYIHTLTIVTGPTKIPSQRKQSIVKQSKLFSPEIEAAIKSSTIDPNIGFNLEEPTHCNGKSSSSTSGEYQPQYIRPLRPLRREVSIFPSLNASALASEDTTLAEIPMYPLVSISVNIHSHRSSKVALVVLLLVSVIFMCEYAPEVILEPLEILEGKVGPTLLTLVKVLQETGETLERTWVRFNSWFYFCLDP